MRALQKIQADYNVQCRLLHRIASNTTLKLACENEKDLLMNEAIENYGHLLEYTNILI